MDSLQEPSTHHATGNLLQFLYQVMLLPASR